AEENNGGSDLPGGLPGGGGGFPASGGAMGYPGAGGGSYPGMPGGGSYPGMPGGGSYPGMPSGGSYPGMPSGGMSGSSGYPGMSGTRMPGTSSGGYPGMGGGGYPGMGPGSAAMMMGGGYPGSFSGTTEVAQYKLLRFFDMDVEPGKAYRYRVRVFLEDPNNPNTDPTNGIVSDPPRRRSLSIKVIERLNQQQNDEARKSAYYVVSDWSEATAPVSLPSTSRIYAGEVEPARMAAGIDGSLVQQSEPRGDVVPVVWHDGLAIDVAREAKTVRGSVLNYSKSHFDVLDPVSLVIKILKNYDFKSQFLVADMRGGEDLPGDRKELVTAAGEFAMVDGQGNFLVCNELDDYEEYAQFSFADELTSRTSTSMPGGMPGGMPGMRGMPGMPGMVGPGGLSGPGKAGGKRGGTGAGGMYPGMPGMGGPDGGTGRGNKRPRR
ncbi:MAG: hypothetical protein ACYC6N_06630, partial [Pirellulaceae bacterium]